MNQPIYSAAGNIVMIHHLDSFSDLQILQSSPSDLSTLATRGKEHNVDSIMVLTGDPEEFKNQEYHVTMHVFEPNAYTPEHQYAGWSTMCGNGVRAVAQYLYENYQPHNSFVIRTGAGDQHVDRVGENEWNVNMGAFFSSLKELAQYVTAEEITLETLGLQAYADQIQEQPFYGFHSQPDAETIDGEPHLVFFTHSNVSSEEVQKLAQSIGEQIVHHSFFPQEINISVASISERGSTPHITAATYERHIYYVTQACGTASTVIGTSVFQQDAAAKEVHIHMPGGVLSITNNDGIFFLAGDARIRSS